jgi:hypothetical protein
MSGKEIKDFVLSQNDSEYTVKVINRDGRKVNLNAINDDEMYNFEKINEVLIGAGMIIAQYQITRK